MLAQRHRWANISQALGQRLVFDRLNDRKRWTEMNGTYRGRERIDCDERTKVNQHVTTSSEGET